MWTHLTNSKAAQPARQTDRLSKGGQADRRTGRLIKLGWCGERDASMSNAAVATTAATLLWIYASVCALAGGVLSSPQLVVVVDISTMRFLHGCAASFKLVSELQFFFLFLLILYIYSMYVFAYTHTGNWQPSHGWHGITIWSSL